MSVVPETDLCKGSIAALPKLDLATRLIAADAYEYAACCHLNYSSEQIHQFSECWKISCYNFHVIIFMCDFIKKYYYSADFVVLMISDGGLETYC